jgi:hypothetical protein
MLGSSSAPFALDDLLDTMGFELVSKLPSLLMDGSESSRPFQVYQNPSHLKQTVTESYIQNLFDSFFAPLGFSASEETLIKDRWTMAAKNERKRNQDDTMSSVCFPECPPCKDPKSTPTLILKSPCTEVTTTVEILLSGVK